jgi:hypothetical protein
MPDTDTRQHTWREIRVTPVTVMPGLDGEPITIELPDEAPSVQVGCFTCNMGLEEGYEVGCPGQDLFEDD